MIFVWSKKAGNNFSAFFNLNGCAKVSSNSRKREPLMDLNHAGEAISQK
jgi:hypothetical protein